MADPTYKKISELSELAEKPAVGDLILLGDISVNTTKRVTFQNLAYAIAAAQLASGSVTNVKLADPYDVYMLIAVPSLQYLAEKNDYISALVPDVHNDKVIVKATCRVDTPSTSGDITVRIYNETDSLTVATVTITAGNSVGDTTSITNPALATNDKIRIDVTAKGTGSKGLTAILKVDKS